MGRFSFLFFACLISISFAAYPNEEVWNAAKKGNWELVNRLIQKGHNVDVTYTKKGLSVRELLEDAGKIHILEPKETASKKRKPDEKVLKSPSSKRLDANARVVEPREINRPEILTKEENSALMALAGKITFGWGYRSGADGQHENFELRTHNGMRVLQFFTDPVFRNLSQLFYKIGVRSYDLQDYLLKNTKSVEEKFISINNETWRPLLAEFMATEGGAALRKLTLLEVGPKSSQQYAIIVGMARILVQYADGLRDLPSKDDDLADILGVADF